MKMPDGDAGTRGYRRFQVFTCAGKRPDWPPELKVSILAESCAGNETVSSAVAEAGDVDGNLERLLEMNERRQRRERLTLVRVFEELQGLGYWGG